MLKDKPTCAVVFSSGSLLKWDDGARIDAFDRVYRFNMAPLGPAYDRHVGSRTTHEAVHFWPQGNSPADKFVKSNLSASVMGLSFPVEGKDGEDDKTYFEKIHEQRQSWEFAPRALVNECNTLVGKKCSTGMLTTALTLKECRKPVLFGVDGDPCYPYHYWDGKPTDSGCGSTTADVIALYRPTHKEHNMDKEHDIMRQWAREGKVELVHVTESSRYFVDTT